MPPLFSPVNSESVCFLLFLLVVRSRDAGWVLRTIASSTGVAIKPKLKESGTRLLLGALLVMGACYVMLRLVISSCRRKIATQMV